MADFAKKWDFQVRLTCVTPHFYRVSVTQMRHDTRKNTSSRTRCGISISIDIDIVELSYRKAKAYIFHSNINAMRKKLLQLFKFL